MNANIASARKKFIYNETVFSPRPDICLIRMLPYERSIGMQNAPTFAKIGASPSSYFFSSKPRVINVTPIKVTTIIKKSLRFSCSPIMNADITIVTSGAMFCASPIYTKLRYFTIVN